MEVHGKLLGADDKGNGYCCGPCNRDNVATPADGFCKECREGMCNSCFQQHLRVRSCVNHVKVGVQSVSTLSLSDEDDDEDAVKCGKHKGQIVRFYCQSHEAVGCGECMLFDHKLCDHEYIKNVSKTFKQTEEYQRLARKVEDLSTTLKTTESQIVQERGSNKAMLTNTLDGVRKFRLDVNKYLDKVEADLISEAKQLLASNDKLLATMEDKCRQISSELKKVQEKIDVNVYKDTVLFVNAIEVKPNLSDIEQSLAQLNPKHIKNFEFVADEQLRNAVSSMRKLGTLTGNQAIQSNSGNQTGARGASGTSIPPQQSQKQTQNVGTIKETRKTSERQTDVDVASGSSVPTKQSREHTQNVARSKDEKQTVVVGARVRHNFAELDRKEAERREKLKVEKDKAEKERLEKERKEREEEDRKKAEEAKRVADEKLRLMNEAKAKSKAVPSPNLIKGWEKQLDPRTNRYFYINHNDGTTQWDPPNLQDEKPIVVGARVHHNTLRYRDVNRRGTVTAVLRDGKVKIEWDLGGTNIRRVGTGELDVTLI